MNSEDLKKFTPPSTAGSTDFSPTVHSSEKFRHSGDQQNFKHGAFFGDGYKTPPKTPPKSDDLPKRKPNKFKMKF